MEQYAHPLYQSAVDVHDDRKFSVIPPGVNTRIFTPQDHEDDEAIYRDITAKLQHRTKPCIIVSSRFDEKKNHLGVVKAYALSQELQAKANLGIFIRGIEDPFSELERLAQADQKILRPILEIIEQQHLKQKVFFLNIRSQQELAATYRYFAKRGAVFALTAFYEPFGLAPIEAAACGLAVVATQNGGPAEIFEDGSGILVDPFDPHHIAEGLLKGINACSYYANLGKQRVKTRYTWEKTAAAYLAIIKEGMTHQYAQTFPLPPLNAREQILHYLHTRP
jgi:sucrose-phosphate synthase